MTTPTLLKVIQQARQEHWALGEFNMSNLEVLQAIVAAANETRSAVIVGVAMGSLKHSGLNYLRGLVQAAQSEAEVPLFFHLDHGADLETIQQVIGIGFSSVMLDTSRLALEENIAQVRRAVEFAHAHNAVVEAQVGMAGDEEKGIGGEEYTDPEQVEDFVKRSGIDLLAFSFGSKPGRLEGESEPDIEVVRAVTARSPVPCVLHGSSSIPDAFIRQAVQLGVAKVNIDAALRKAFTKTLKEIYCQEQVPSDPRVAMRAVREAVKDVVLEKMRLFGSIKRA
jgi:fructose-bisphosphate aldolase, class II